MFTGIVKKVSKIKKTSLKNGSLFFEIERPESWDIGIGDSISINGVCSTVRRFEDDFFEVEYMPETIKKTTAGELKEGDLANLERSLKMSDLLDGHVVQGHVDTKGEIVEIKDADDSKIVKVKIPEEFMKLVAPKGSVTIDGISLTVVDTGSDWFTVSLVSYTIENTNMRQAKIGDGVNVETDVLAKYICNFLERK
ncbi:MAG: riboflavin synthase [Candidatus Moranbacteria bacterium]|nr:riboflavin synthase [Candidatus Moranbacteria bacterium]